RVDEYDHLEAPLLGQVLLNGERLGAGGPPVQRVERAHEGGDPCLSGGMEWRQIVLPQRVLGNLGGIVVASAFGCTVSNIVFRAGDDTFRSVKAFALITANVGASHS